jgi:hypothetical protein
MPLIELYDILCEVRAQSAGSLSCFPSSDKEIEQVFLEAEKEFIWRYDLTPEQIVMIKREGHRLKNKE